MEQKFTKKVKEQFAKNYQTIVTGALVIAGCALGYKVGHHKGRLDGGSQVLDVIVRGSANGESLLIHENNGAEWLFKATKLPNK